MTHYQGPFTGDNLCSSLYIFINDASKGSTMFKGAYIQVEERAITRLITVIDIVYFYLLRPIEMDRISYTDWARQFVPRRRTQLIEAGRTEDLVKFVNESKLFIAWILSEIDTEPWTFYTGRSYDHTCMLMLLKHDENNNPNFYITRYGVEFFDVSNFGDSIEEFKAMPGMESRVDSGKSIFDDGDEKVPEFDYSNYREDVVASVKDIFGE